MKQFLSLLIAAAIIISCNDTAKVADASDNGTDSTLAKNTENMKEVYRAIETGDVSKIRDIIADDFVDHEANPDGSDLKGKDTVLKMLSMMHTYWDGLKVEFMGDATSADGNTQYAMVRMTGKYSAANPWGVPAGTAMDDTSVDVIKIKDGKATDHWGFASWKDVNEMMAAAKQGPPAGEKKNK